MNRVQTSSSFGGGSEKLYRTSAILAENKFLSTSIRHCNSISRIDQKVFTVQLKEAEMIDPLSKMNSLLAQPSLINSSKTVSMGWHKALRS